MADVEACCRIVTKTEGMAPHQEAILDRVRRAAPEYYVGRWVIVIFA